MDGSDVDCDGFTRLDDLVGEGSFFRFEDAGDALQNPSMSGRVCKNSFLRSS